MGIKKGYKKTIMGEIPHDWQLCEFSEVMDGFTSGQTPYRAIKKYYKGEVPWITSGELNYNVITETNEKITEEAVKNTGLKVIPKGTFLFAITGLEAEGTRGSCAITGVEATTNQSCMALYPKKNKLITPYLYQYYLRYGNELALKYCQGTKQQSFTGKIAKKLPIIVPPTVQEQTAIVTVLIETDELISKLEKIIEKKRSIKQGTMQKLLKQKEDWDVKKLGSIADMNAGGTPLTTNPSYYNGGVPWVVISDITSAGKYINTTDKTLSIEGLKNSSAKLFKKGVILFAMYASIGKVSIAKMDTSCNQAILGISPKGVDTEFLYYYLSYLQKKFLMMGQTGTQSNLSKELLQKVKVPIPPTISEQEHIANILSDIDNEISSLDSKLKKLQRLKQGMLQQLLTGKIKLV